MSVSADLLTAIETVAVDAAQAAGAIQREHARDPQVDATTTHDVKLQADRLSEQAILSRIRKAFPDHAILAEESGSDDRPGEYRWIVDPLDGTVNYYYGLPYYCTSIACYATHGSADAPPESLASLGQPLVGVIYAPPTDELFLGVTGRGATLNAQPIRASAAQRLGDAIISIGFNMGDEQGCPLARVSAHLANRVRKLRCLGAAALDLANVAVGRLTGFYEERLRPWDIAAAAVILAEAGAVFRARQFTPTWWRILAAGPGIADELDHAIDEIEPDDVKDSQAG